MEVREPRPEETVIGPDQVGVRPSPPFRRVEGEAREWRERPWIMAGVGAAGGLLVHVLTDGLTYYPVPTPGTILRQSAAAGNADAIKMLAERGW